MGRGVPTIYKSRSRRGPTPRGSRLQGGRLRRAKSALSCGARPSVAKGHGFHIKEADVHLGLDVNPLPDLERMEECERVTPAASHQAAQFLNHLPAHPPPPPTAPATHCEVRGGGGGQVSSRGLCFKTMS